MGGSRQGDQSCWMWHIQVDILLLKSMFSQACLKFDECFLIVFVWMIQHYIIKQALFAFCDSYNPDLDSDPYGEEGNMWSFNYFFYNKRLKRIVFFTCRSVRWVSFCQGESHSASTNKKVISVINKGNDFNTDCVLYYVGVEEHVYSAWIHWIDQKWQ